MRAAGGFVLLLWSLVAATGAAGPAREATPVSGCAQGPATPVAGFQTVDQEIAVDLDRLFGCLTIGDWAGLASFVAIPAGQQDPFEVLSALEQTGLFVIKTRQVSQAVRSTSPSGATVDLAWGVGSQVRFDRWTFQKRGSRWRVVNVAPAPPQFDGTIVGITGRIGPNGVELSRTELNNPGGVELLLEIAPGMPTGSVVLVFPRDACTRAGASALTAVLEPSGDQVTLSLDAPDDGAYALALVATDDPPSRASICASPVAVLTMTS